VVARPRAVKIKPSDVRTRLVFEIWLLLVAYEAIATSRLGGGYESPCADRRRVWKGYRLIKTERFLVARGSSALRGYYGGLLCVRQGRIPRVALTN
jgi:hypothetical protein